MTGTAKRRVELGIVDGIITEANIKYKLVASKSLKPDYFAPVMTEIYQKFGEHAKEAANALLGNLGKSNVTKQKLHFTTSLATVVRELSQNEAIDCKPVLKRDIRGSEHSRYVQLVADARTDDDDDDGIAYIMAELKLAEERHRDDEVLCYQLIHTQKQKFSESYLPIHKKIYDLSAVKMYELRKRLGGRVVYQHCDTFVVEGSSFKDFGTKIGDARRVNEVPAYSGKVVDFCVKERFVRDIPMWEAWLSACRFWNPNFYRQGM